MTKLPVISGEEAIKVLNKAGFVFVRQKGSHVRMKRVTAERAINVTIPLHDVLDRGTLRSIIKAANLTVEGFVERL
ncbi:MAG: type II toxin-antitoxin system HicA family toxin [Methanosarcinales archaeon Met12]|nr:MAG: type II toxin-antitoxin system HicA family toxin [Methanosarcinales archaeon Met12]